MTARVIELCRFTHKGRDYCVSAIAKTSDTIREFLRKNGGDRFLQRILESRRGNTAMMRTDVAADAVPTQLLKPGYRESPKHALVDVVHVLHLGATHEGPYEQTDGVRTLDKLAQLWTLGKDFRTIMPLFSITEENAKPERPLREQAVVMIHTQHPTVEKYLTEHPEEKNQVVTEFQNYLAELAKAGVVMTGAFTGWTVEQPGSHFIKATPDETSRTGKKYTFIHGLPGRTWRLKTRPKKA